MLLNRFLRISICSRNISSHYVASRPESQSIDNFKEPIKDTEERLLKVAIIGLPNAGKSTLINSLMDRRVFAVSTKAHTTRCKSKAIFTRGSSQIVFTDTPGLVQHEEVKRFNLERSFMKDSKQTLAESDMIGVIHDVGNHYLRDMLDQKIIDLLVTNAEKKSFLVLNKIDMLKSKRKLLDVIRTVTEGHLNGVLMPNAKKVKTDSEVRGFRHFSDIFMISALTGSGLDDLRNYLVKQAIPGKWMYKEDVWSDQSTEKIIIDTVKAQLLNFLPQEMPYRCVPALEFLNIDEKGIVTTVVLIKCPTDRVAKLVAGGQDGRLKQIIESVQKNLQNTFQNFVRVNLVLQGPNKET